ncbi:Uncharacterised protein [Yersinia intermedia]|uniref:Uncharacterized protein n=1 Tax=Yersinia intermedia TaxID=631 RepID=A0A0H5LZD0_YERIN|nr:fimbria/pilus periplasmic chaperone [Yersinia intermedia]CRY56533.1 Uncharacterised protein [Yersinia intermedia]
MGIKLQLWVIVALMCPFFSQAISVGPLTFTMNQDQVFIAKRVYNDNPTARIYQVNISALDRPGSKEVVSRPAGGELLFSPKQLVLAAGKSEYYKFFYHGPKDQHERYYRVSFREVPTSDLEERKHDVELEPVIVLDTILVVRPRDTHFDYRLDREQGAITNSGNTFFKYLIKPGCGATDEQGTTVYIRPGETFRDPRIKYKSEQFIIFDSKFISLNQSC